MRSYELVIVLLQIGLSFPMTTNNPTQEGAIPRLELPWPSHPVPQPDEALTSWLARVGIALHVGFYTLCKHAWPKFGFFSLRLDRRISDEQLEALASRTEASREVIKATTLWGVGDHLLDMADWCEGRLRWLLPHQASQYCPDCLKDDPIPYFRRSWKLAFVTTCEKHGHRSLAVGCPSCGAPINLSKRPACSGPDDAPRPLWECRHCQHDLRDEKDSNAPCAGAAPDFILELASNLQVRMMDAVGKGWIDVPGIGPIYSHLFFEGVRQLAKVLLSSRFSARLRMVITFIPDAVWPKALCVELASRSDRAVLLGLVGWLLEDWPNRFVEVFRSAKVFSNSIRDGQGKELPYWLDVVVREELTVVHAPWRRVDIPKLKQHSYSSLAQRQFSPWVAAREAKLNFIREHPTLTRNPLMLAKAMREAGLFSKKTSVSALKGRVAKLAKAAARPNEWWRLPDTHQQR